MVVIGPTEDVLDEFESAARLLYLVAGSPPPTCPRPPWWRPVARRRHLLDHDEALALWAETVETFAVEVEAAEHALELARARDRLRENLG